MFNHQSKEHSHKAPFDQWFVLCLGLIFLSACELTTRKDPIERIFDMGQMTVETYDEAVCQNLITIAENQCCSLLKSLHTDLVKVDSKKISICTQNEQVSCIDQNEKSTWVNQQESRQVNLSPEDQAELQIEACALATDTLKAYQVQFKECAAAACDVQADLAFAQNIACVTVNHSENIENTESTLDDLASLTCGLDEVILDSANLYPSPPILDLVENRFELLPSEINAQVAPQLSVSMLTTEERQQTVDHFTLSLTSDFFSNLFARGGLRPALSALFNQDLDDRFTQPWQCHGDPLKCQTFFSNLIKSALEVKISQIRDQINVGMQAVLPENALSPDLQTTQNQSLRLDLRGISLYSGEASLEKGSILIENTKPTALRFDLSTFRFLATHHPAGNDQNLPIQEDQLSRSNTNTHQWINQAELLWDIPKVQCETLASDINSSQLREKRSMQSSPYRCRCAAPPEQAQIAGDWKAYCVTDPYPYPQGKGDLNLLSVESHLFLCDQNGSHGIAPDRIGDRLGLNQGNSALLKSFISDDLNQFACQSLVGNQGIGDQQLDQGQGQGQDIPYAFGEYAAFELKIPIQGGAMRARMMGDQSFSVKAKFPLYQQWQRDAFEFKFDQAWTKVQSLTLLPIEQDMELLFDLKPQNANFSLSAKDQYLTIHGVLRYQSSAAGKSQLAGIRRVVLDADTQITQEGGSLALDPNAQNVLCRLSGSLETIDQNWILNADSYETLKDQSENCDRLISNQMIQLITQRINEHFLYKLSDQIKSLYTFAIDQALFAKVQGGVWVNLINEITSAVWLSPLKVFKYVDEQVAQDLEINPLTAAQLWGPAAMLCAAHAAPDLACPLVAKVLGNRSSEILKVHTQSSPQSIYQQFSVFALDEDFPPVDFCENLQTFDLRNRLIKQDLMQKDADDPISQVGAFAQCSIQVKQSLPIHPSNDLSLFAGIAKVKFVPTKQTELLINRALICRTLGHCSPDIPDAVLDDGDQLADRAHLALCSILADFWYQPAQDQDWRSLVDVLKDSQLSENQSMIAALLEDFGLNPVQGARDFNARFANCKNKLTESNILINDQPKRRKGTCEDGLVEICGQETFCGATDQTLSCESQMCLINGEEIGQSNENLSCLSQSPEICVAAQNGVLVADRSYQETENGQNLPENQGENQGVAEQLAITVIQSAGQDERLAIASIKQNQLYFAIVSPSQVDPSALTVSDWQMASHVNAQASLAAIHWSASLNQGVILWINDQDQNREIAFRFFDEMGVLDSQIFQISASNVTQFKSLYVEDVLNVLYDDALSKQLKVWTYHPVRGIQSTLLAQNTLAIFDLSTDASVTYASPYGKVWFKPRSNSSSMPIYQDGTISLQSGIQTNLIDLRILPRTQGHLLIETLQNDDQSISLRTKALTQTGRSSEAVISPNLKKLYDQGSGFLYTRSMIHPIQNIEIQALYYQVFQGDGAFDLSQAQLVFPIDLNYPKINDAKLFDGAENLWMAWIENQRGLKIGRYRKICGENP